MPLDPHVRGAGMLLTAALLLGGCGNDAEGAASGRSGSVAMPQVAACRLLTAADVARPSNATDTVDCAEPHTAETYAVGELPETLSDAGYDDPEVGTWAYRACTDSFMKFLGADESLVMRTVVSWAWFRPSEQAWDDGARWYRCDVVGGGDQSKEYVELPDTAKNLLRGKTTDEWMVCASGPSVSGSVKIPCSEPHDWRAVTTIKLGEPADLYPGDRLVQVRTRDFCSESVGAWLGYPIDYDYGYTWFHDAEWQAGNRRSVCWARTSQ